MAKSDAEAMVDGVVEKLAKMIQGQNTEVHVAQVVHYGDKLILPEAMSKRDAIEHLKRQLKYDEEAINLSFEFPVFLFDGALAMWKCMKEQYGFPTQEPTPGFFSNDPPHVINVATGPTTTVAVPWGRMSVPGVEGWFQTEFSVSQGRFIFKFSATVKRMYEKSVNELAKRMRVYLQEHSIYRGRAVKLRLRDDDGDLFETGEMIQVMPSFMDVTKVDENSLVYNQDVRDAIFTNLFIPIKHTQECRAAGVPLKRGILLAGPYGVGKSLTAYATARVCQENGWTFFYCERANELADMVGLAKQYTPSCIFCEDIDRVMSGERDMDMDTLLNVIDGIESKGTELMVVLTTNHLEHINRAMLRPGRLDAVIHLDLPDHKTVETLIRRYAGDLLPARENIEPAATLLQGEIPAVIRECVERAKLSAVRLCPDGGLRLSGEALKDAATLMRKQLDLLNPAKTQEQKSNATVLAEAIERMVK